jgi:flagellar basal-body rod protein FlgG
VHFTQQPAECRHSNSTWTTLPTTLRTPALPVSTRRLQFSDLIYQNIIMPGAAATQQTTIAAGLQVGLGTMPGASEVVQTQGNFSSTGNPLDMAIQGLGFFQVTLPDGQIAYTRAVPSILIRNGKHCHRERNPASAQHHHSGQRDHVTIGSDGTVSVTHRARLAAQQVGSIQLAMFPNPGGLNSVGNNLYLATTASGDPIVGAPGSAEGMGTIQQGMLEQSNVDVVAEFVNMIVAQRSYESNSRVVTSADQMLQDLAQLGR